MTTESLNPCLRFAPEVAQARAVGRPVVALESTIVAHGMPYPENLHTARAVEDLIRAEGATPATIAVMEGCIHIGLSDPQLTHLAQSGQQAMKLSRRDLAFAVASRRLGATTVASTMLCAALAGIRVFVTGGIGGVHRGAPQSMDVSADLLELARTPVAVVCAGAKSILDLPLTLEVLETHGVPVVAVGQSAFPAFYTRDSGLTADFQLDTPTEIAHFLQCHWRLGLPSGVVVANPVPMESEIPRVTVETWLAQALAEAEQQGISGKASTPFLLKRLAELSQGRSLATNIALVKNNAVLGGRLAVSLGPT
ncbi:pseudouridine-5'-phosphate glycosidase [Inhella gelatinilytica]|uniref:Pseudouridine-5'-phosphate glycosidase n=1 Tax=Inhella gelatinilytica TaxID=2795030 RepID=A0A931NEU0_9BURK|nr:pseudouridine-5'-phosphate glycosidase [Inhella gelatinilytica]MBH9553565.1 pseudouridine-5'-phosphate glycosidase [Inhella gelatinilytica]